MKAAASWILYTILALFIAAALLAVVAPAFAAGTTANLSWTQPTAYNDGTPMPASDIASYTVTYTYGGKVVTANFPAGTLSTTVSVPCGGTSFEVDVSTTASAVYPSTNSAQSNLVPYASGVTCAPNAPVLSVH